MDKELLALLSTEAWCQIDYDYLMANNPTQIRSEEMAIEIPAPTIPHQLTVENIKIRSSDNVREIRSRIYRPKGKSNLPILLYFHGGAFVYGTPEQYDFIFYKLALDVGMLIVSVDYRLAPENPFPAGMEDGYDVLLWLAENGHQIGGNKENILIGGSSAGATIAASITHAARDRKKVHIRHQYLLYPAASHLLGTISMLKLANAPMQSKASAEWMWKYYLQDNINFPPKYAVPLLEENFKDLPNATIVVCEFDPLKDEGKLYAQKLQHAKVVAKLIEIKGAIHTFDFFPCNLTDNFYNQQVNLLKEIVNKKI